MLEFKLNHVSKTVPGVYNFVFSNVFVDWTRRYSKVHGAKMGPTWGRQDPGGPHVGPMNFAISDRY